jgi:glutathione S-transferase
MKLYDIGAAPNPRRVRIFLAEKGIEIPLEPVNLMTLEQYSDGFTEINPMQRVPVLVLDDGTAIAESLAICRYFEEIKPEPNLFGATPLEAAQVEMWNRRIELHFYGPVSTAFRHINPSMATREVPQFPEFGESNRPKAEKFVALLESELGKRPYIAGDRFTVADILAMTTIDFMRVIKLKLTPEMKHLSRWHNAVSSRPSAKA